VFTVQRISDELQIIHHVWRDSSAVKAVPDQRPADIIPRNNVCSPRIGAHILSCWEASIPRGLASISICIRCRSPAAYRVVGPLSPSAAVFICPVPALLQRPSPAAAPFRRRLKNAAVLEDAEELYLVKRLIRE